MANITVLGAGFVGKAIALDLANQHQITAVDVDINTLDNLTNKNNSIKAIQADLSIASNITSNIQSADLVVSAVPGFMGYKTLSTIIESNKDVIDIAFFPENALDLDKLAKLHDVTAIVDIGVAPGLSNLILGYHSTHMDVKDFKCMVGGLPKNPHPPFNYKAPFSPVDVIEEYTRPARIVRDNQVVTLPALSEIEEVEFKKTGKLEAFNTDGLRTLIHSFPNVPNMVEKTLRYPGHAALMQSLIDIGFLDNDINDALHHNISPLQFSTELLKQQWKLEEKEPEFTVMSIEISGRPNQEADSSVSFQYFLYDEYDFKTNISSMARTTGYTCTAAVNLLLEKKVTSKGIIPPEVVGKQADCYQQVFDYLKQRGITIEQSVVEKYA